MARWQWGRPSGKHPKATCFKPDLLFLCYLQPMINPPMITRRTFLGTASALALADHLFAAEPTSTKPSADLEKLGAVALNEAKRLKATYCDIRIQRMRSQTVSIVLNPERGTN